MAQWLLGAIVTGVAMLHAKDWVPNDNPGFTQRIGPALKEGFKRSKWWLLCLALFALIKLVTPSTDQGKQAAFALMLFIGYLPIYAAIWLWHTQRAYRGIQPAVATQAGAGISLKRIGIALLLVVVVFGAVEGSNNKFWATDPVSAPASGQFIPDSHQPKGNADTLPRERNWSEATPASKTKPVYIDPKEVFGTSQ